MFETVNAFFLPLELLLLLLPPALASAAWPGDVASPPPSLLLVRLEDAHALQGVDEWHDAMRAVTNAAEALGVVPVNFDALAKAQRRVEDEREA